MSGQRGVGPSRRTRLVRTALAAVALIVALGLVVAACTNADSEPTSSGTPAPGATTSAPTDAEPAPGEASPSASPSESSQAPTVTLAFGGDVAATGVGSLLASDPSAVFAGVRPALAGADFSMINLETAITDRGTPVPGKEFTFRTSPRMLTAVKAGGVDAVTLANNHGMDYGQVGLADTLRAAKQADLPLLGAGKNEAAAFGPRIFDVKGAKVGVVAATHVLDNSVMSAWTAGADKPGLASAYRTEQFLDAVRSARAQADTVVVFLHWGTELATCPNERQRDIAPKLVEAGADVVVGSHAHLLLGGGYLDGAYVDYGLGNFVFPSYRESTRATGVLQVTVQGREVRKAVWKPAVITNSVPRLLSGSAAKSALAKKNALRSCTGLAKNPS